MNLKKLIVPVLCVLLGCAGGAAMGTVTAQTWPEPASVQRWQQECVYIDVGRRYREQAAASDRERGERGWELVAAYSHGANGNPVAHCYKRPAP